MENPTNENRSVRYWIDARKPGKQWRNIGHTTSWAIACIWIERAHKENMETRVNRN